MSDKQLKAWDRRPWPTSGDSDEEKLYAAVGRALSAWERCEAQLAFLFAQFLSTPLLHAPIRAYCAVRTFEGRADMLRAASKQYFWGFGIPKDHDFVVRFKVILSSAIEFSKRRNDIAHGVVDHYHPQPTAETVVWVTRHGYALFPAYGSLKDRDHVGIPAYCYTSAELDYFREQFTGLHDPARILGAEIAVTTRAALHTPVSALPRISRPPSGT